MHTFGSTHTDLHTGARKSPSYCFRERRAILQTETMDLGWLTGQWANQAGRLWFRGQGQGCSWVWYSVSPDEIWVRRLLEPQSFLVIWPERIWGAERRGEERRGQWRIKGKRRWTVGKKRWLMSACVIICVGFTLRLNQKVHFKWGNSKKMR